jgi:xylulokinase
VSQASLFLGIDVSTGATKALLLNQRGSVVAVASWPHNQSKLRLLWSEQDAEEWWKASCASI